MVSREAVPTHKSPLKKQKQQKTDQETQTDYQDLLLNVWLFATASYLSRHAPSSIGGGPKADKDALDVPDAHWLFMVPPATVWCDRY